MSTAITASAPILKAARTGTLLLQPPSTRSLPSHSTGGSTPGIAMEAVGPEGRAVQEGDEALLHQLDVPCGCVQTTHEGADARSHDEVDRDLVLGEDLEDAHVGESPGGAASECQSYLDVAEHAPYL